MYFQEDEEKTFRRKISGMILNLCVAVILNMGE